jgi:conjugal transfer pilus assembly protein TraW
MVKYCLRRSAHQLLSLAVLFASFSALAGVRVGPVYPIAEPDLLEHIASKLKEMERNGDMDKLKREFIERSKKNIEAPKAAGLPRAQAMRAWLIDPTYTLDRDLEDGRGNVFARAGDRVNPLDRGTQLREPLLFINGDDTKQRENVSRLLQQYPAAKLILVQGRWRELSEQINRRVYFDQSQRLIRHFGIAAVPAVVTQQGNMLRVMEMVP